MLPLAKVVGKEQRDSTACDLPQLVLDLAFLSQEAQSSLDGQKDASKLVPGVSAEAGDPLPQEKTGAAHEETAPPAKAEETGQKAAARRAAVEAKVAAVRAKQVGHITFGGTFSNGSCA